MPRIAMTMSYFDSEHEANDYKEEHQLFQRVAELNPHTGKWMLNFPLEAHVTVIPGGHL